jgi:ubiquinone/menaquinone biosynthesis C-methylase UbiE
MTGQPASDDRRFIPALRFSSLTPVFDTVVRFTTREKTFKERLLREAAVAPGESVLDLGAGTGTLAIMLEGLVPGAQVTGLDADPEILALARRKAAQAGARVEFVEGFSTELPFAEASFDVVLSTLFFHHLEPEAKRTTLSEVARVLRPGGRLHVADWGKPTDPLMAAAFLQVRVIDGFAVTADNASGALPSMFEQAGLEAAAVGDRLRTPLGMMALYRARKPAVAGAGG